MATITLIKTLGNTFKIAYNSDYEIAKKIKVNEPIEYDFKNRRNIKFHRKYFALLNMVFDNQEQYSNIDHLRHDLTIEAGYYEIRYNLHGVQIYEPKSISFAAMNEITFSEFYNKCIDVIVKHFHFDREDIAEHILQYF